MRQSFRFAVDVFRKCRLVWVRDARAVRKGRNTGKRIKKIGKIVKFDGCPRFVAWARNGFEISRRGTISGLLTHPNRDDLSLFQPSFRRWKSRPVPNAEFPVHNGSSSPPSWVWPTYGNTSGHTSCSDTRRTVCELSFSYVRLWDCK